MTEIWLAALIIGSMFALASGEGVKGKLLNLVVILSCMALGYGIGYAAGLGSQNMGLGAHGLAMPLSVIFGIVGAVVSWLRDN
jgi:hypothetical protein